MPNLLSRSQAKTIIFDRDNSKCVNCGATACDAHHLIDRSLWEDQGYYIDNLVSLCSTCHIKAETTELSPQVLREKAQIKSILLPHLLYPAFSYDKWGNLYPAKNSPLRFPGELFYKDNVQKILSQGDQLQHIERKRIKYPRTFHFSWSQGLQNDDRHLPTTQYMEKEEIVVTEKMDGENTTLTRDKTFARSPDSQDHPSRSWIKQNHSLISQEIPEYWRICGENMYAQHSIKYNQLPSYFLCFNIWNEHNYALSWKDTETWAQLLGIETVPVLYKGPWNEDILKQLAKELELKQDSVEGYVVRPTRSFPYTHFPYLCGKYVRQGHVQTSKFWRNEVVKPNTLAPSGKDIFDI